MTKILVNPKSTRTVPAGTVHTPARLQCSTTGTCSLTCMALLLEKERKEIAACCTLVLLHRVPENYCTRTSSINHGNQSGIALRHACTRKKEAPRKSETATFAPYFLWHGTKLAPVQSSNSKFHCKFLLFYSILRKVANFQWHSHSPCGEPPKPPTLKSQPLSNTPLHSPLSTLFTLHCPLSSLQGEEPSSRNARSPGHPVALISHEVGA